MLIQYDADADVLMVVLGDSPPVDALEERGGVIISYGEDGVPVTVELLEASKRRFVENGTLSVTLQEMVR